MKVLGISIEANKAIFCGLEKVNQECIEISSALKKLELKDHLDSEEVRNFQTEMHAFLAQNNFDKVGIITRGTKGRFAASPISFKIEGLIQTFPELSIDFVAPATLRAYFKKNENAYLPKFGYQKDASELAVYLLKD